MNEITKSLVSSDTLQHHGVMGMHWGVRRYQPYGEGGYDPDHKGKFVGKTKYKRHEKMNVSDKNDSSTTRKVKRDYNDLTDKEFSSRYHVSKNTYRKRVNRYGDPYMNSPLAKIGKKLSTNKRINERVSRGLDRELKGYAKMIEKARNNPDRYVDDEGNNYSQEVIKYYQDKGMKAMNTVQLDGYKVRYNVGTKKYEVYR